MNKAELVEAMAFGAKVTKADADRSLDAAIEAINKALKKGDRVAIAGFGTFQVKKRAARVGRNPQTGKTMNVPAKNVVRFKAGSELSGMVNK
jgi:DNA-binding protein HU-beta